MSFTALVLFFTAYSFIGWFIETVYCSVPARKFVYRGFLMGPVCPIYGFGALSVLLMLSPFSNKPILVFFLGLVITSTLEYVVSVLLEKLFKKSWWDYSARKFNLNGRICLLTSMEWGALSVVLVYAIHPALSLLYEMIPPFYAKIAAVVLPIVFAGDLVLSVLDTIHFNRDMLKVTEITALVEKKREELKELVENLKLEPKELLENRKPEPREKRETDFGVIFGQKKAEFTGAVTTFKLAQKEKLEQELAILQERQEETVAVFLRRASRIMNAFPHMRLHRKDKLSLRERFNLSRMRSKM